MQLASNLFLVTVGRKIHPSLWRHPKQGMQHKEFVANSLAEHEEVTGSVFTQELQSGQKEHCLFLLPFPHQQLWYGGC